MTSLNPKDAILLDCPNYEDYLDTFITKDDLKYVRNVKYCRMLVELGYRSTAEVLSPSQFEVRRDAIQEALFPTKKSAVLFSEGIDIKDQFLLELKSREKANYQKVVSTIIFMRCKTKGGFEISGYIDYDDSLRKSNKKMDHCLDFRSIFEGKKLLKPRPVDLSFYHCRSGQVEYNNTINYYVKNDPVYGLSFMYKGDRKIISVDPTLNIFKDNVIRTMVYSDTYGFVTIYDHLVRRKI